MFLRDAMRPPKAVEYNTLSWQDVQQRFRDIFLTGGETSAGINGAERVSPIAAAHRILCNDFGVIPFSTYRKEGSARYPADVPGISEVFKTRPNDDMTPYMLGRTVMSNAFWWGFGAVWNRRVGGGSWSASRCLRIAALSGRTRRPASTGTTTAWTASSGASPATS